MHLRKLLLKIKKEAGLNKQPIALSSQLHKEKSVLCTGFPVNTDFSHEAIGGFISDIRSYKKIRLLGSAALSIAYVAAGRVDVYKERDIMIWDVAGAIPILLGAGGNVKIEKALKRYSFNITATNIYL